VFFQKPYELLADFPDSGAPRPKVGRTARLGVVFAYIVIYRHVAAENLVIILRIVHGRRGIAGKMLQAGPSST
jgi:toxin ParE1/3/4